MVYLLCVVLLHLLMISMRLLTSEGCKSGNKECKSSSVKAVSLPVEGQQGFIVLDIGQLNSRPFLEFSDLTVCIFILGFQYWTKIRGSAYHRILCWQLKDYVEIGTCTLSVWNFGHINPLASPIMLTKEISYTCTDSFTFISTFLSLLQNVHTRNYRDGQLKKGV